MKETCWNCKHRQEPWFEGFRCGLGMVSVDGRGVIARIFDLSAPWPQYEFDALHVGNHRCEKYEKEGL